MIVYSNLIITCGLLEAGPIVRKAEKSKRLYGKVKSKSKWIYWTKVKPEALPEAYRKHFK